MMGVFDEMKAEGLKMVAILGIIFGFLLLWITYSVSIWLVIFLLVVVAGVLYIIGRMRGR